MMPELPFPKVMAMGDACSYLSLSPEYITQLANQGRLRCQKTSAGRIFLEADIIEFQRLRKMKAKGDRRFRLAKPRQGY